MLIFIQITTIIKNATLIERDGKIVQIGKDIVIPENSIVKDLNGNYIYPSFIEIHSSFSVKKPERRSYGRSSQYEPTRKGYYWNDHILSDYNSMKDYTYSQKDAKALRRYWLWCCKLSSRSNGVHRGTSFTLGLIDNQNESFQSYF